MKANRWITCLGFTALCGVLVSSFYYVFEVSFDRGHMYPEHSSLRADPRGVMMLFETLERIDGINAKRSFEPFSRWHANLPTPPLDTVYIILDAGGRELKDPGLTSFLERGGRLVLTLRDANFTPHGSDSPDGSDGAPSRSASMNKNQLLKWMAQIGSDENAAGTDDFARVVLDSALTATAPERIHWRAKEYLQIASDEADSAEWHPLYKANNESVIIGRKVGNGHIIILANGLPLTNESLYAKTDAAFFKWLLGDRTHIIFDEYHFGITQPRGIALLIRQYNLELTVLTLLLPFLLLLWYGASPLLPPTTAADGGTKRSQTALSGYRDLLQRYLKRDDRLLLCLDEWKATFMTRKCDRERYAKQFAEACTVAKLEAGKPRKKRDFQSAYQTITEILNRRR